MSICTKVAVSTLVLSLLSGPSSAFAQGGVNVALIDISYVFKNHTTFTQRSEAIKKEVKDYESQMNDQRKALTDKRAGLQNYKVGSPEYEKLEADIANEIAQLEVAANQKRRDILEREAKVYFETYQEVQEAIAAFCGKHGIGLVLRYDSEPIDPADRASVLRGVNRAVIYQDRIDITREILSSVNAPRQARR
ncbi:MAG: OmpH family outer membrane protein [Planctomycetes bacterium]|nr:OmpH family outer membrane protein [Planctomycetota bacterium]